MDFTMCPVAIWGESPYLGLTSVWHGNASWSFLSAFPEFEIVRMPSRRARLFSGQQPCEQEALLLRVSHTHTHTHTNTNTHRKRTAYSSQDSLLHWPNMGILHTARDFAACLILKQVSRSPSRPDRHYLFRKDSVRNPHRTQPEK